MVRRARTHRPKSGNRVLMVSEAQAVAYHVCLQVYFINSVSMRH
jgi:hypothetical protein